MNLSGRRTLLLEWDNQMFCPALISSGVTEPRERGIARLCGEVRDIYLRSTYIESNPAANMYTDYHVCIVPIRSTCVHSELQAGSGAIGTAALMSRVPDRHRASQSDITQLALPRIVADDMYYREPIGVQTVHRPGPKNVCTTEYV